MENICYSCKTTNRCVKQPVGPWPIHSHSSSCRRHLASAMRAVSTQRVNSTARARDSQKLKLLWQWLQIVLKQKKHGEPKIIQLVYPKSESKNALLKKGGQFGGVLHQPLHLRCACRSRHHHLLEVVPTASHLQEIVLNHMASADRCAFFNLLTDPTVFAPKPSLVQTPNMLAKKKKKAAQHMAKRYSIRPRNASPPSRGRGPFYWWCLSLEKHGCQIQSLQNLIPDFKSIVFQVKVICWLYSTFLSFRQVGTGLACTSRLLPAAELCCSSSSLLWWHNPSESTEVAIWPNKKRFINLSTWNRSLQIEFQSKNKTVVKINFCQVWQFLESMVLTGHILHIEPFFRKKSGAPWGAHRGAAWAGHGAQTQPWHILASMKPPVQQTASNRRKKKTR